VDQAAEVLEIIYFVCAGPCLCAATSVGLISLVFVYFQVRGQAKARDDRTTREDILHADKMCGEFIDKVVPLRDKVIDQMKTAGIVPYDGKLTLPPDELAIGWLKTMTHWMSDKDHSRKVHNLLLRCDLFSNAFVTGMASVSSVTTEHAHRHFLEIVCGFFPLFARLEYDAEKKRRHIPTLVLYERWAGRIPEPDLTVRQGTKTVTPPSQPTQPKSPTPQTPTSPLDNLLNGLFDVAPKLPRLGDFSDFSKWWLS
jgi:hypothetical protein